MTPSSILRMTVKTALAESDLNPKDVTVTTGFVRLIFDGEPDLAPIENFLDGVDFGTGPMTHSIEGPPPAWDGPEWPTVTVVQVPIGDALP